MLFQLPGLNTLYLSYHAKKLLNSKYYPEIDGDITKLIKHSTYRMCLVFLGYLIPMIIGSFLILNENFYLFSFVIAIEICFLLFNFSLDYKYNKKLDNKM